MIKPIKWRSGLIKYSENVTMLLCHRHLVFWLFLIFLIVARVILCDPSLSYDEAEQLVFAQNFSFGYPSQPPLYTWIQWFIFKVGG